MQAQARSEATLVAELGVLRHRVEDAVGHRQGSLTHELHVLDGVARPLAYVDALRLVVAEQHVDEAKVGKSWVWGLRRR